MTAPAILEKRTEQILTRTLHGAVTALMLVTLDLVADAEGGVVKQIGALSDVPFGQCEAGGADGVVAAIVKKGVQPMICVDASIEPGTPVYNDATGKVTASQGQDASLVGSTTSRTTGANEIVSVEMAL